MKPDALEDHLSRIPLQNPPEPWRDAILGAATRRAAQNRAVAASPRVASSPAGFAGFIIRLRQVVSFSPWSVLAGGWVIALVLHAGAFSQNNDPAPPKLPFSPQDYFAMSRAYQAEIAQLLNSGEAGLEPVRPSPVAVPPGSTPTRPRTSTDPIRRRGGDGDIPV